MQATIQTRLPIQNVEMELQSDAKLVYCLEQNQQGVWYITRLECIYEKDSLTPVKPTTINLPKDDFTDYRPSYACLSYALNAIGYDETVSYKVSIDQMKSMRIMMKSMIG